MVYFKGEVTIATYNFREIETGETFQVEMSISQRNEFVEEHKGVLEQLIPDSLNIVDPFYLGLQQPPRDFQEGVLGRMKAAIPNNNIKSKYFRDF